MGKLVSFLFSLYSLFQGNWSRKRLYFYCNNPISLEYWCFCSGYSIRKFFILLETLNITPVTSLTICHKNDSNAIRFKATLGSNKLLFLDLYSYENEKLPIIKVLNDNKESSITYVCRRFFGCPKEYS